MNIIERKFQAIKFQRQVHQQAQVGRPQPSSPMAHVVVGCLTSAGLSANGKGSKEFLAPFCQELRKHGCATYFCTSLRQIDNLLSKHKNVILINVFGEDHDNIVSPTMIRAEARAAIVFNRSEMGAVIADKQQSLEHFTKFGVPMPPMPSVDGLTFSNARKGTRRAVEVVSDPIDIDQDRYNRAMIDTVHDFQGRSYYTSVRLMCIADKIVQAMVRVRPIEQGDPSVTGTDTPLDAEMIKHFQIELVDKNLAPLHQIARQMHSAIGPSFVAHDILVEKNSDALFVCESGYKFSAGAFQKHLAPIRQSLPFYEPLFDIRAYARKSAQVFVEYIASQGIADYAPD